MQVTLLNAINMTNGVATPMVLGQVGTPGTPFQIPANKIFYVLRRSIMLTSTMANGNSGQFCLVTYAQNTALTTSAKTAEYISAAPTGATVQVQNYMFETNSVTPLFMVPGGNYVGVITGFASTNASAVGMMLSGYIE